MKDKLKSRKLWVAVLGSLVYTLADELGVSREVSNNVVQLLSVYLLSQSAVDVMEQAKKKY